MVWSGPQIRKNTTIPIENFLGIFIRESVLARNTEVKDAIISARIRSARMETPNKEKESAPRNAVRGV